jgi:hypothetical protein
MMAAWTLYDGMRAGKETHNTVQSSVGVGICEVVPCSRLNLSALLRLKSAKLQGWRSGQDDKLRSSTISRSQLPRNTSHGENRIRILGCGWQHRPSSGLRRARLRVADRARRETSTLDDASTRQRSYICALIPHLRTEAVSYLASLSCGGENLRNRLCEGPTPSCPTEDYLTMCKTGSNNYFKDPAAPKWHATQKALVSNIIDYQPSAVDTKAKSRVYLSLRQL